MTTEWHPFRRRVRRIGLLQLWRHTDCTRWAVSLDNRTYHNFMEIPPDRVARWLKEFDVSPDRIEKSRPPR
jgi:hypothetical protein